MSKLCPCIHEIKKIVQENVKNCTLISHFAPASRDEITHTPYRGFALDHTEGRKSPKSPGSPFYAIPGPPL